MFVVEGLQQGKSSLSGKTGEVLLVRCEQGTFRGALTPKEFIAQVRLRSQPNHEHRPQQS